MKSQFPGIAALAAQIEMFGLSKREIEKKFRRSELSILAWRSQEVSASFDKQTESPAISTGKRKKNYAGQVPEGLPDHFYNEDGEIDLRQVTGAEAYKFLMAQGMKLPIIGR
jgi:hypothetical protein